MSRKNLSYCVILPVTNETVSLEKTIDIIVSENYKFVKEIIIVSSKIITTPDALKYIHKQINKHKNIVKHHIQTKPYIGGAIEEGFNLSKCSHTIMMASDLETDPKDVRKMISLSIKNPNSLITANRWLKKDNFIGYSFIKLILNYFFQLMLKLLYGFKYGDFTYGFRLFPTYLIKNKSWKEKKHPFLLETLLVSIISKHDIIEIPSRWKSRQEGISQNTFFENFNYIKTAFRVKFFNKEYK